MLSIAYRRFIRSACSGRPRAANSRAARTLAGPEERKSESSDTTTEESANRYGTTRNTTPSPHAHPAEGHGSCEEGRPSRNQRLGLRHVRHDLFDRLARAAGDAGQRHRRAHQFQKGPARGRIGDGFNLGRKLVVQSLEKRRILSALVEGSPPAVARPRAIRALAGEPFRLFTH